MEEPRQAQNASRGGARGERKGSGWTGRAPPRVDTRGDDASSRRASPWTTRRAREEAPTGNPSKRSADEPLERMSRDRARASAEPPPGPSPRMTRAAQVLREAKALMRELSPRNDADGDVHQDARSLDDADDADALDVAHTGGRWRSLRAPASSARARLEAEAEDERAFAARGGGTSRARVFAAIAAAAPPRGPFAEDDFGASRLVERTGALRAASAAAAAAAAAARGWCRPEPLISASSETPAREKRRVEEEVRELRERLMKELAEKETRRACREVARDAETRHSATLAAANAAREKAAAVARARKLARAEVKEAESCGLRAENAVKDAAQARSAAAKKASARRNAVIAAESLALAAAHFDHQLLRRRGLAPWRTYAVCAAGAAAEATARGKLASVRRAARAWHARARLRISRRACAVAKLASARNARAAGDVWFAWRSAAAASSAATRQRSRRALAAFRAAREKASDDAFAASACHARAACRRAWRAWLEMAGCALAAARARRARDAVAAAERRARAALSAWSAAARGAAEARRKTEAKDALFSKVGTWLEEMRGDMSALTPSSESESARSSPASREARRARFYAGRGVPAPATRAAPSPSPLLARVSPEDEPRAARRAPTPLSSPLREATPAQARAPREWSPEETPARALSMPSPTPKTSSRRWPKTSSKKSPTRTDVDPDARRLAFSDDGFADENDASALGVDALAARGAARSPADAPGARSEWLRLDDVTPPDVSLVSRRERSEARRRAFRSRAEGEGKEAPVRRIAELERPNTKPETSETPLAKTMTKGRNAPLRATEAAPAGYSAATRARLARLAAKKKERTRTVAGA